MKIGLMVNTQDPPRAERIADRWRQILEIGKVAEDSGFAGIFLPEHHMMEDGYLPSPWAPLGALAARTQTIEIGTSVHLLPLENPIHVAEHAAIADIISNGRLRLGCGMGNFAREFDLFGLSHKQQVSRFEEAIDLLQRAWAGEHIDHDGKHFRVKGRISPLPLAAHLWLGAMSDPGVRRAARFGCRWITDPLHNIEVLSRWSDIYHEAAAEHGTADSVGVTLMRYGYVADSLADVEREWWPAVRAGHWFYFSEIPRLIRELEPTLEGVDREEDLHFDRHRQDRLVVGSPADCIATIERMRERLDFDYLIIIFRMASGPQFDRELECIKRFGREVIPALS